MTTFDDLTRPNNGLVNGLNVVGCGKNKNVVILVLVQCKTVQLKLQLSDKLLRLGSGTVRRELAYRGVMSLGELKMRRMRSEPSK
jgi:hypothetical protein